MIFISAEFVSFQLKVGQIDWHPLGTRSAVHWMLGGVGGEESFRWFHTLFAVWRAGFWNFALNPWCAVLFESAVWNYFPKNREHGTHIALLASPMQAVGSWDSFITWPIHNSPLKFRGRSPSMNTQRHYCGQKWAGLVNTILFILKKFFS